MSADKEVTKVLITAEDVKNIRDFYGHFQVEVPEYLSKHLETLEKASTITLDQQALLKTLVARSILESEHEIFKDSLFEEVIPTCEKEWFEAQFNEDFESAMEVGDTNHQDS